MADQAPGDIKPEKQGLSKSGSIKVVLNGL
jgi:hypothetical protein